MNIPVCIPEFDENELNAVTSVMRSGWIARGEELELFEKELAAFLGVNHVVTVNSGTAALEVALRSLKIEKKEVITTATSCAPTANAIIHSGNIPVMADVSKEDYNVEPEEIEKLITPKTGAILPVHVYGRAAKMDRILQIAKKQSIPVIEDCAQSFGAKYKGKMTGTLGDIGCFSLNINKVITTGEGGFIATNNNSAAESAKMIRNYGRDPSGTDYCYTHFGHNFKFTNLQAAIGRAQLRKAHKLIEARRSKAQYLRGQLKDIKNITLPKDDNEMVWFSFPIIAKGMRDKLKKHLEDRGIEVRTMFRPMCDQPYYKAMFGERTKKYPNAEYVGEHGMYIGCYPKLTKEQMDYMVKSIKEGLMVHE